MAIAIPTTRAVFERELANSPPWDFVRRIVGGADQGFTLEALWENYQPLAALAESVLDLCRQVGVEVIEPTLEGLSSALRRRRVVTIFAHWKEHDPGLPLPDFEVQEILEVLMTSSQDGPRRARESAGFDFLCALADPALPRSAAAAELSERLCQIMPDREGKSAATGNPGPVCQAQGSRIRFGTRRIQQAILPGIFEPSARLELSEGHYSKEQFCESIPEGFTGLIDLAICHSRHLGDHIKKQRRCFVAMATNTVAARDRFIIQKGVLEYLGHGINYAKCLTEILNGLKG